MTADTIDIMERLRREANRNLLFSAGDDDTRLGLMLSQAADEIERLRGLCACAYQLAGVVDAPLSWLDALNNAANGESFSDEGLLPVRLEQLDGVQEAVAAERQRCKDIVMAATLGAENLSEYGPEVDRSRKALAFIIGLAIDGHSDALSRAQQSALDWLGSNDQEEKR